MEFRYALRAHGGYDPASPADSQSGCRGRYSRLLRTPNPAPSRLRVEPSDVALKANNDGDALIVRLFGASGQDRSPSRECQDWNELHQFQICCTATVQRSLKIPRTPTSIFGRLIQRKSILKLASSIS